MGQGEEVLEWAEGKQCCQNDSLELAWSYLKFCEIWQKNKTVSHGFNISIKQVV